MTNKTHKRLTIDLSAEAHQSLKGTCAHHGMTMKEFVLTAICKQLEELEDKMDLEMAERVSQRIKDGEEELISWEEMMRRIGRK